VKKLHGLIIVLVLLLTAGNWASGADEKICQSGAAASWPGLQGVTLEKLKRAGLSIRWVAQLPFIREQKLIRLNYAHGTLYGLTNNHVLFSLAGSEGTLNWSSILCSDVGVCLPGTFGTDQLMFVIGRHIVEVSARDGSIKKDLSVPFLPTTNAARLNNRIFVGAENLFFYCLRYDDGMVYWQSKCPTYPIGNVYAQDDKVYFACRNGVLYVSQVNERLLIWQYATGGEIPGFALDNKQCFVPSKDTAIYGFNGDTGAFLWPRYLAGGTLDAAPVVTKQAVYQAILRDGLLCLNRADGTLKWQLKNGDGLLAETERYCYVITLAKEMTLMNQQTQKEELSFLLPPTDVYASNTQDSMIYLGTDSGVVVALQPAE